jgi:hypothetical protein
LNALNFSANVISNLATQPLSGENNEFH